MNLLRRLADLGFAAVLLVALLAINLWLNPARFALPSWGTTLGLAAPLIGAAVASTPSILSGRGGIDISVGPLMGFVNAILVKILIADHGVVSPFALAPAAVLIGLLVGAASGFLVVIVRIQPIVATLGVYLILTGVTLFLLPAPMGDVPPWVKSLAGAWSFVPLAAMFAVWALLGLIPYRGLLMAVGSDDRAAYTAGAPVAAVRWIAYALGGAFAGVAGLMETALIGSADPAVGTTYTLLAIAAAALGGVSLAGGRGGVLGAAIGAADIFLLQSALTFFNTSTFVLQIAYGVILVVSVTLIALQDRAKPRIRAT